jgi:hypothetical protein
MEEALAGGNMQDRLGILRTHLDNIYAPEPPYGPAFAAGMACWVVASEAVTGESYEVDAAHEREFDPDYWPPCFFASAAEAGGAVWEQGASPDRRAGFWRWYLLQAVPAAREAP